MRTCAIVVIEEARAKTRKVGIFQRPTYQKTKCSTESVIISARLKPMRLIQETAAAFPKINGKPVETNRLIEMLKNQEKQGIIKADTASVSDEPEQA